MKAISFRLPLLAVLLNLILLSPVLAFDEDACTRNDIAWSTPSSDFTAIADGSIVRHETTGLEWQRCALGQNWTGDSCDGTADTHIWQDALSVAADTGDAWRLPSVNELRSIVEECRINPAINRQVFPNTPSTHFWSASPYAGDPANGWSVNFENGFDNWLNKTSLMLGVRLVRGGQ